MASVANIQHGYCGVKAATNNIDTNGCGCFPVKTLVAKTGSHGDLACAPLVAYFWTIDSFKIKDTFLREIKY